MFADIETLAHGIRHDAFKNGQRLKKISNTDSAERSAFFNKNSLGAGMATSLTNENKSKRNSINSFQNAITYMQSQKGALDYAGKLFSRMKNLAHQATNAHISDFERGKLSEEFNALNELITDLSSESMNKINLFDSRASSISYDINFDSSFDASILHDGVEGGWKYWDVKKDTLYNSGIMTLDISPGGAGDRFVIHQGDASNPIFDTGVYTSEGHASKYDFDQFIVEYGPNKDTTFKFKPLSEGNSSGNRNPDSLYHNKKYYLNYLLGSTTDPENGSVPSDSDYMNTSGWESKMGMEFTELPAGIGNIKTDRSDPTITDLHLRVYSNTWFDMRANWSLPELDKVIAGNKDDVQVELNPLGLGLVRQNDSSAGFPVASIDTIENAKIALDVIGEELGNVRSQLGKLSSNMERVQASIHIAETHIGGSERALSQITNAGLEDDALAISKSRIYRSKSAALLTQAMSVNQDVANFLL